MEGRVVASDNRRWLAENRMRDDGTTTYQLWHTAAGHAFFEEGNQVARGLVGTDGKLVWSVKARSWDEARRRMHAYMGWPPYRPTPRTDTASGRA